MLVPTETRSRARARRFGGRLVTAALTAVLAACGLVRSGEPSGEDARAIAQEVAAPVASVAVPTATTRPAVPVADEGPPFDWKAARCPLRTEERHAVLVSPTRPSRGRETRVILALAGEPSGPVEARFDFPDRTTETVRAERLEVTDASTFGFVARASSARAAVAVRVRVGGTLVSCRNLLAVVKPPEWDAHADALFSLWVARLVSIPPGEAVQTLDPLLRSPERNLLFQHRGLGEDGPRSRLSLAPDCADLPVMLRAYFAWKLGLPFAVDRRGRTGDDELDPGREWEESESAVGASRGERTFDAVVDPGVGADLEDVREGLKRLALGIGWSDLRPTNDPDRSVLYPVAVTRDSLRPGTVFVDPHSHVSIVAGWEALGEGRHRLLLADAQPNGVIAVHRYVEGRLVFGTAAGSAAFQWFRPTVRGEDGDWQPLPARALLTRVESHLRLSIEERRRTPAGLRERIEWLQDPTPRDPLAAYRELHEALVENLRARARAVDEGYRYRQSNGETIRQPRSLRAIFHGYGEWEVHATPCRDLKVLALMRTIEAFPEGVASNPSRYRLEAGEGVAEVRARLERARDTWWEAMDVTYTRSDGSSIRLPLREIFARRAAFEAGYNPNDCPELRWGSSPETSEFSTCSARAPENDRTAMERHRAWFRAGYGCE